MYEAFDFFLNIDTWHTRHPSDENRFFVCLNKVVRHEEFSPDEMGEYMRQKTGRTDRRDPLAGQIDKYVALARTIKQFVDAAERGQSLS